MMEVGMRLPMVAAFMPLCGVAAAATCLAQANASPGAQDCGPYAGPGTAHVVNYSSVSCQDAVGALSSFLSSQEVRDGEAAARIGEWECFNYGLPKAESLGYAARC